RRTTSPVKPSPISWGSSLCATTSWSPSSATCSPVAVATCLTTTLVRPTCPRPGLLCPVGDKVIYAVPGVPYEMREMLERAVLPDLERRAGVRQIFVSRTLRTWGESESRIPELL